MKKTLLLCFIHGFKGGDDTFGPKYQFTEDLRRRLSEALPKINVRVVVYPQFETRGDLADCVGRFRDWLLEKVIDIEVDAHTPSPTVDPSVRTILIGHSMGGIVAAETVIALTSDRPIPLSTDTGKGSDGPTTGAPPTTDDRFAAPLNGMMFPYIQGVLAFDTPFLGISPGVVAHGAEGHYTKVSETLTQLSGLTGALWGGGAGAAAGANKNAKQLPPAPSQQEAAAKKQQQQQQQQPSTSWGRIAMYAGAGAALAAGGAAAYLKREQLGEGFGWASSHLEFVGCLARGEELRRRVAYLARAEKELGMGFGNLYTRLGRGAGTKQVGVVGTVLGRDRTFCNLPARTAAGEWREAVNERAGDEVGAHMGMFEPKENPGYDKLLDDARNMVVKWLMNDWYDSSSEEKEALEF